MRPSYGKRRSDRVREEVERKFAFPFFVLKLMENSDFDLESKRIRARSRMQFVAKLSSQGSTLRTYVRTVTYVRMYVRTYVRTYVKKIICSFAH